MGNKLLAAHTNNVIYLLSLCPITCASCLKIYACPNCFLNDQGLSNINCSASNLLLKKKKFFYSTIKKIIILKYKILSLSGPLSLLQWTEWLYFVLRITECTVNNANPTLHLSFKLCLKFSLHLGLFER